MTTTQHIGAAGEILVQYRLLKLGIDSARMTTDSGIAAAAGSRRGGQVPLHAGDVKQHLLERRTAALFGVPTADPVGPVDA